MATPLDDLVELEKWLRSHATLMRPRGLPAWYAAGVRRFEEKKYPKWCKAVSWAIERLTDGDTP